MATFKSLELSGVSPILVNESLSLDAEILCHSGKTVTDDVLINDDQDGCLVFLRS